MSKDISDKLTEGLRDGLAVARGEAIVTRATAWDRRGYRIEITPGTPEDGTVLNAVVPELPGCMSDGDTLDEAEANAKDAINCWIEACEAMGRKIPKPKLKLP